jgi:glutamate racemase
MEPAVKPAAQTSRSGVVGVLATANTLSGKLFRDTAARWADRVEIIPAVGEGFVELVENDMEGTQEALEAVRRVVEPILAGGADRLVLGCTHYPLLAPEIRQVTGSRAVELIDPAPAVARRVASLLTERDMAASPEHEAVYDFFTAADERYLDMIRRKAT